MYPNQPSLLPDQNSPQDTSNVWFDNVLHADDQVAPPKKSKKPLVIGAVLAVALLATGGFFAISLLSTGSCLDSDDYALVSGLPESQAPTGAKDAFYTASFTYGAGTDQLSDSSQKEQLDRIARLVRERGTATSIQLSIRSNYYDNDTDAAALKRSEAIQSYLESNGVPGNIITIDPSEGIDYTGEIESEAIPTDATAYVTLSSANECRAN